MATKKKKQTEWQKKFSTGFKGGKSSTSNRVVKQDQSKAARDRRRKSRAKKNG